MKARMLSGKPNESVPEDWAAPGLVAAEVIGARGVDGKGCVCSILTVALGIAFGSGGS